MNQESKDNRDKGMNQAIKHADEVHESWSSKATMFLIKFIRTHKEFMTEQVREASKDLIPTPPSQRAWGGIIRAAANSGVIRRKGYKSVSNPNAHCTPATLWEVVNF